MSQDGADDAAHHFDVLVLGSGVAGASAALALATREQASVAMLTKKGLEESTTRWAQGGIATAGSESEDSVELHLADSLRAGAGLCDEEATRLLVEEGPARVQQLIELGAVLDRDASGRLELSREGGHSVARVVHAGGAATGAEVTRALAAALRRSDVSLLEGWFAYELLVSHGRCCGVLALDRQGALRELRAETVILATGGAGQLFEVTTNPPESTGDGIAMALRAGVAVADVEFVQFHPTALAVSGHPRPLLSEALRGHGALLLDSSSQRFVDELAPRDVVSRAIASTMAKAGLEHVFLDVRSIEDFAKRFSSLAQMLSRAGLDPARDLLPVAPAAHYFCGGILTDLDGASSLPGLFAVGEVACTGVHGANRLASNSLLEGLVFAGRAAQAIVEGRDGPLSQGALGPLIEEKARLGVPVRVQPVEEAPPFRASADLSIDAQRSALQRAMSANAGVVRSEERLQGLLAVLLAARQTGQSQCGIAGHELANLAEVGLALVKSAITRQESRGAHARVDYPELDDARFRCRLVHLHAASGQRPEAVDHRG